MSASTSVPLSVSTSGHRRSQAGTRVAQPQQINLFGDERQNALVAGPAWQELPVETQSAVTNLMARLLLEYIQGSGAGSATEAVGMSGLSG